MRHFLSVVSFASFAILKFGCEKSSTSQPDPIVQPWENGQSAEAVFGQSAFTTGNNNPI